MPYRYVMQIDILSGSVLRITHTRTDKRNQVRHAAASFMQEIEMRHWEKKWTNIMCYIVGGVFIGGLIALAVYYGKQAN